MCHFILVISFSKIRHHLRRRVVLLISCAEVGTVRVRGKDPSATRRQVKTTFKIHTGRYRSRQYRKWGQKVDQCTGEQRQRHVWHKERKTGKDKCGTCCGKTSCKLAKNPSESEVEMQALIGGRNAGGLKRENTRAWPAVKTGVDWLKQRACSVRRHGAGGVKRKKRRPVQVRIGLKRQAQLVQKRGTGEEEKSGEHGGL